MQNIRSLITLTYVFLILTNVTAQTLDYAQMVGGTGPSRALAMTTDLDKNSIVVGEFSSWCDFDPGPGQYDINGGNGSWINSFVVKYDSLGNVLWAHETGAGNNDSGASVVTDSQGNILVCGYVTGTVDLDPGPGSVVASGVGGHSPFLQKFDPSGNLIWAKHLTVEKHNYGGEVVVDENDNIFWAEAIWGNFYIDVLGVNTLFQPSGNSFSLLKIQPSGDIEWVRFCEGGTSNSSLHALTLDGAGNIIFGGRVDGSMDFDPGPSVYNLPSTFNSSGDAVCVQFDSQGNFDWAFYLETVQNVNVNSGSTLLDIEIMSNGDLATLTRFDADQSVARITPSGNLVWGVINDGQLGTIQYGSEIALDNNDGIISAYEFDDSTDVNPGLGINMLYASSICGINPITSGLALQKLNMNGQFVWGKAMSGCGGDIHAIESFDDGSFSFNGAFYTGFDLTSFGGIVMTSYGSRDFLLSRFEQDTCSNLSLVIDNISSLNCSSNGQINVSGIGGTGSYEFALGNGGFNTINTLNYTNPGIVTISIKDSGGCQDSTSVLLSAPTIQNGFDLNSSLAANSFRPGFESNILIDGFSEGCTAVSGTMKLVLDAKVQLVSSSIVPDNITGDTLIWNFASMNYNSTGVNPALILETNQNAVIGDSICLELIMSPSIGDYVPLNNVKEFCFPVVNGYDPNDKRVNPMGKCAEKFVENEEELTYTIRFQNTGNAEAVNINILDTISSRLNVHSARLISSSHDPFVEVIDDSIFNFTFNAINLPDSATNFNESIGYVTFAISPINSVAQGDLIENSASIYFDFNPPIHTNATINTIFVGNLSMYDCYLGVNDMENQTVEVYPNPAETIINIHAMHSIDEIKLYSVNGQECTIQDLFLDQDYTYQVDVSNLSPGAYLIEATCGQNVNVVKVLIH